MADRREAAPHVNIRTAARSGRDTAREGEAVPALNRPVAVVPPELHRRMALHLQRTAGNRATAALLGRPSSTAGAPATPIVQRAVTFEDGTTANTAGDLAVWYGARVGDIDGLLKDLAGSPHGTPVALSLAKLEGQRKQKECQQKAAETADGAVGDGAKTWYRQWVTAMNEGEALKAEIASERLEAAKVKGEAAVKALEEILGRIRASQRRAFQKGAKNELLELSDKAATVLDCALASKEYVVQISETITDLRKYTARKESTKYVPGINEKIPKIMAIADLINKSYAAFQTIRSLMTLGESGKTAVGGAANKVGAAASMFSSVGTLIGAAGHVGLLANLYIGPLTDACINGVKHLSKLLSDSNQSLIEAGALDLVRWGNEPGGRPMAEYMITVMHAGSPADIPRPIPKMVASYFEDHADTLSAGVGGKDEVPQEGWIFKDLNENKMATWLFRNRADVWGMLYGKIKVPSGVSSM